jgi:hypothetical protein
MRYNNRLTMRYNSQDSADLALQQSAVLYLHADTAQARAAVAESAAKQKATTDNAAAEEESAPSRNAAIIIRLLSEPIQ